MKRFLLAFWLIIFALGPISGKERASLDAVLSVLEPYVDNARIAEDIPGAVVVIVKDGKIVYLKGFGVKVLGQKDPVDGHTPFALASVTKSFTNTLVARLVDQGKLQWTDRVSKYLPNFQMSDSKISQELTIEDLLSHRSGLAGFSADTLIELGWSAPEIISAIKLLPLEGEFRKTYGYQNALVGIVGNIIEKVTGKPLQQVYFEELFQPVGLEETRIGERAPPSFWQKILGLFRKRDAQPTFHDRYKGKARYLPNGNPGIYTFPASSGIISTGYDLGKWMIFQLNKARINGKALVSEANINRMHTPHIHVETKGGHQFPKNRISKVEYGLGWYIHDYDGVAMLSHMGGMAGTRSFLLIIPEDNVGIAILANIGGIRVSLFPEAIRNKFLDLYLNVKEEVDWATQLRESYQNIFANQEKHRRVQMLRNLAPPRDLNDYVGVYENALYGRVEFTKNEDGLILTYRDRPKMKLLHWNGNIFSFNGSDLSFGFPGVDEGEVVFSDERGKANRMMINLFHEGADSIFNRVE